MQVHNTLVKKCKFANQNSLRIFFLSSNKEEKIIITSVIIDLGHKDIDLSKNI